MRKTALLSALSALALLACDQTAPPTRTEAAPTLFRMAGGSATGNALEFLLPDTSAPAPVPLPLLPAPPHAYGHGPWLPEGADTTP